MDLVLSNNLSNMAVDKHLSREEQIPGGAHSQMQNVTPAALNSLPSVPLASPRKIGTTPLSYLPIKIGTREIQALIDSGASNCFARPEAIPQGTIFKSLKMYMRSAIEGATVLLTRKCRLTTKIGNQLFDIEYIVSENLRTMVTLGTDWMREVNAILHFNGEGIVLQGHTHRLMELTAEDLMFTYYGQIDVDAWMSNREPFVTEMWHRLVEGTREETVDIAKIRSHLCAKQKFRYDDKAGLYKLYGENTMPRLYVPEKLRWMVINRVHFITNAPHPNESQTLKLLCKNLYWPHMREQIHSAVRGCPTCNEYSRQQYPDRVFLRVTETTTYRREIVVTGNVLSPCVQHVLTPQSFLALWHRVNERTRQSSLAYAPTSIMPSSTMTREDTEMDVDA